MSEISADELKALLQLEPHPREGGWFRQTWKAEETIPREVLPGRYAGSRNHPITSTQGAPGTQEGRSAGTAIYYLLEPGNFSEMHMLKSDEVFHFYLGDAVEMLQLWPDGSGKRVVLGRDVAGGELLQTVVPQGVWQGTRLIPGGKLALLGCTVSPGFDYADYASGTREELVQGWPAWRELIDGLTRG